MKSIALIAILTTAVIAQDAPAPAPAPADAKPKRTLLKYTVPASASAGARSDGDGGSREKGEVLPKHAVLTPNHVAFTTQAQPSLFWFQDGPVKKDSAARVEVALIDPKNPKPLLKVGYPLSGQKDGGAGVHRVQLARYKVNLEPNIEYKWSVALVPNVKSRSQDSIASGVIKRIEPAAELTAELAKPDTYKASAYLAKGVWYDALASLSDEIDAAPKDAEIRAARADLLEQVGLKSAADYERKK